MFDGATGEKMSLSSILDLCLTNTNRVTNPISVVKTIPTSGSSETSQRSCISDPTVYQPPTIMVTADLGCGTRTSLVIGCSRSRTGFDVARRWSSSPDTGMVLPDKIRFHKGAWVGDHLDMRLYDDVAEYMKLDGWVDVTPELTKEVPMIWKSECELEGEFEEELSNALKELRGVWPKLKVYRIDVRAAADCVLSYQSVHPGERRVKRTKPDGIRAGMGELVAGPRAR